MSRVIADGLSEKGKTSGGLYHTGNFDPATKQEKQGGATLDRPSAPANFEGYFDTDLGKPIWYTGAAWVDSAGVVV